MKAVKINSPGDIQIVETSLPELKKGELLLKTKYVGFCGSDLSTFLGKNPMVTYPRIPGHEVSAVIEHIGDEVPNIFKVGQAVTVVPYTNCGQCSSCKQKRYNACKYNETLGVQRDGAMAEYIAIPWEKIIADEALNAKQLALVEPLTVGFHAIDNAKVSDNDFVMVLGCGMIGSGAIIRAALRGATVIAVDIDDSKLKVARQLGAHYTINSNKENLHENLMKITNDFGPGVVIEAAGNPLTYQAAINEIAFAGRVVCIGYAGKDIEFATKLWVQKELTIMGSRNANPSDFEAVVKYLKEKAPDTSSLISKVVTINETAKAMKDWTQNTAEILKIMVEF